MIVVDVSIANAVVVHIQIDIIDVGGDRLDMMYAKFGILTPRIFAQVGINGQFLRFLIAIRAFQLVDIQIVSGTSDGHIVISRPTAPAVCLPLSGGWRFNGLARGNIPRP